jgi:hypothetical protein
MRYVIIFCVLVGILGCEEKSKHEAGRDIESTRYANIVVQVKDILKASNEASLRLQEFGGHVIGNTMSELRCDMTVRLEPKNLERFLEGLEELGQVLEKVVETRDILEQSLALQAQVASLQAFEQRLLIYVDTLPKDIPLVLAIEQELKSVRDEIAKAVAHLKLLEERQDYAVVDIGLVKKSGHFVSIVRTTEEHPPLFVAVLLALLLFSVLGFMSFVRFSFSRLFRKGNK